MGAKDKTRQKKYKAISLFSGAMGLDLGVEETNRFELLACVEIEKSFCDTIKLNRDKGRLQNKNLHIFNEDIAQLDPMKVLEAVGLKPGELDLLIGGPPCQSFSTAGKRRTVQDPRGSLLWHFLRFVEAIKPRYFVMENVRGLLSAAVNHRPLKERPEKGGPPLEEDEEPGSVVRLFAKDLAAISGAPYRVDCFEVNAVNYGAPQLRERAIFIGNRFNDMVDFPNPTHGQVNGDDGPRQMALLDQGAAKLLPHRTLGDVIRGVKEKDPVIMDFSPRKKHYLGMVPPGGNWRWLPVDVQQESMGRAWHAKGGRSGWWRRLSYDLPCPTVVTMPNHAGTALCHPDEVRALTVKECALIQEFPADWEFVGTAQRQYAQVGNAVPVRLGKVAGTVVAEHLDRLEKRSCEISTKETPRFRLVYVQSHVRTRQWFKDGKTFAWTDGEDNAHASYSAPQTLRRVSAI